MSREDVWFSSIKKTVKQKLLKNRFVFITSSNNTWLDFVDRISQIYDFTKLNYTVFLLDAGKWLLMAYQFKTLWI